MVQVRGEPAYVMSGLMIFSWAAMLLNEKRKNRTHPQPLPVMEGSNYFKRKNDSYD